MRGRKHRPARKLGTDEFIAKETPEGITAKYFMPITIYMHQVKQEVCDYYEKRVEQLYDLESEMIDETNGVTPNTSICIQNLEITSKNNCMSKLVRNQKQRRQIIICDTKASLSLFSKQDLAKVVNTFWLDKFLDKLEQDQNLDNKDYLLEEEEMQKYSFELENHVIYFADGVKSKVKELINPNTGTFIEDFQEFLTSANRHQRTQQEHMVIVPKMQNGTQQQIKQFIEYFRNFFELNQVTADIFEKLQFINDEYIIKKVYNSTLNKPSNHSEPMKELHNSKAVLKMKLQNSQSIFYRNKQEDDQIDLSIDTKTIANLNDKQKHVQQFQATDFQILGNACITVYDDSLKYEATQLCNLMGAIVLDDIVPFMTTHIVALKHTPILKHQLSQLENQLQDNMNRTGLNFGKKKQSGAIHRIGSLLNIKVVTIDWLKQCFNNEQMLNEELYVPIYTTTNGLVHQEQKKKRRNYKIKQNIFNGKTFAVSEESFYNESLKEDDQHVIEVQERIQNIEKIIIENSGRVIDQSSQSMFLIIEDGYDQQIWDHDSNEQESQIRIHPRFIFECQKHKAMLDHGSALHLLPLPHKIPMPCFNQICVEFALVGNPIDALVFEGLVKLFGIKKQWVDGKTTHLIIFETDNLDKSVKLQQIRDNRFKSPIEVVDTNWLFDSMKLGRVLPEEDFRVQF